MEIIRPYLTLEDFIEDIGIAFEGNRSFKYKENRYCRAELMQQRSLVDFPFHGLKEYHDN